MWRNTQSKLSQGKRIAFLLWVYLELWLARVTLWLVPFRYLKRRLGRAGTEGPRETSAATRRLAWRVGDAVTIMSAYTPFKATCLVQALAARRVLTAKHVRATLYFGVHRLEAGFGAHAWLRVGTEVVTGGPESADNAVVGSYS